MITFIVIILIIWLLLRLFLRSVITSKFSGKQSAYNSYNRSEKKEGEITIVDAPKQSSVFSAEDKTNKGEYVDFEEV